MSSGPGVTSHAKHKVEEIFAGIGVTAATAPNSNVTDVALLSRTTKPMRLLVDEIVGFSVLAVFTFFIVGVLFLCLWANGKCYKRNKKASRCCPHIDSPTSSVIFSYHDDRQMDDEELAVANTEQATVTSSSRQAAPIQHKSSFVAVVAALKLATRRHTDQAPKTSSAALRSDDLKSIASEGSSEDMAQATFGIDSLGRKEEYAKFLKERYLRLQSRQASADSPDRSHQNSSSKITNVEALDAIRNIQDDQPSTSRVVRGDSDSRLNRISPSVPLLRDYSEQNSLTSQSVKVGRFTVRPSANSPFTPTSSSFSTAGPDVVFVVHEQEKAATVEPVISPTERASTSER